MLAWSVDRNCDVATEHQAPVDAALDRDVEALVRSAREYFGRSATRRLRLPPDSRPIVEHGEMVTGLVQR